VTFCDLTAPFSRKNVHRETEKKQKNVVKKTHSSLGIQIYNYAPNTKFTCSRISIAGARPQNRSYNAPNRATQTRRFERAKPTILSAQISFRAVFAVGDTVHPRTEYDRQNRRKSSWFARGVVAKSRVSQNPAPFRRTRAPRTGGAVFRDFLCVGVLNALGRRRRRRRQRLPSRRRSLYNNITYTRGVSPTRMYFIRSSWLLSSPVSSSTNLATVVHPFGLPGLRRYFRRYKTASPCSGEW